MSQRPNILILHTDQQRFDSLGCTGSPSAHTPHLDALAADGVSFTRHISSCPICQPSRAGFLTGLYPPGHQLWTNGVALPRADHAPSLQDRHKAVQTEEGFHFQAPTLADVFATAGYRTAAFGKLHLKPFQERNPNRREAFLAWEEGREQPDNQPYYGFETYEPILGHGPVNYWRHGGAYRRYLHQKMPRLGENLDASIAAGRRIPEIRDLYASPIPHEHSDAGWLVGRFGRFLDERPKDRPFCCFVGFPGPHHPFAPSYDVWTEFRDATVAMPEAEPADRRKRALMAAFDQGELSHCHLPDPWRDSARAVRQATDAMVHEIDRAVGRIVEHLKHAGVWDNTIVVFTSDHGDFLGDFGLYRKTCLNAAQLLRVPLILRIPGAQQGTLAEHRDLFTSNTDILPTLAAAAGIPLPAPVHGIDLTAEQPEDRPVFAYAYQAMNRKNDDRRLANVAVFQGDDHYLYAPQLGIEEVFNLSADPHEMDDRSTDPARRGRMAELRGEAAHALLHHHSPGLGKIARY